MLLISGPGLADLRLVDLVCDFDGTLAHGGFLLPGVNEALAAVAVDLSIHVVTADIHKGAARELKALPVSLHVIAPAGQSAAKREFVERLGVSGVVALGTARSDHEKLAAVAIGIGVIRGEGAVPETAAIADVVVPTTIEALELLCHPRWLADMFRDCP